MILWALAPSGPGGRKLTDQSDGDRAVSPVVAVVLLLAIAVTLAAVAGPFMFGVIGDFGSDTPDADLSFHYEQGKPLGFDASTDDFGTLIEQGDGVVTIQFQDGETLNPANVEIRGRVSGGNLLNDTPDSVFAEGDSVRDGERLTLTAMRSETVEVVWTGDGGGESAILDEFTIDAPPSLTGPFVPDANRDCGYIEDQLDSGTSHIQVIGVVVECDLTAYYPEINDITIESQNGNLGAIIGEVNGTGDINIRNGGTFQGNLESGTDGSSGDIDIKNGSTVYSDVVAKGDGYVDIDGQSTVEGMVDAVQGVSLQSSSSVSGDIVSGTDGNGDVDITDSSVGGSITTNGNNSGNVDIDKNSTVGGPVDAMGTVNVQRGSVVDGPITSGTDGSDGKVKLKSSDVNGNITVEGDNGVDVLDGSDVDGSIEAPNPVNVKKSSTVAGGVTAAGDIQLSSVAVDGRINATDGANIDITDSIVGGHVDPSPSGTFSCTNSVIRGQSCDEYKQAKLAVDITNTTSPVSKGDDLLINVTVKNEGFKNVSDLRLLVNGTQKKTKQLNLARNTKDDVQFRWNTSSTSPGVYNVTIASDIESESRTVHIGGLSSPAWGVESVSSKDKLFTGNTLNVSAMIKNDGQSQGNTTVRLLDFDGQTVDTKNVTITDGGSQAITLQWDTNSSDIGTGTVTVDTDMDSGTDSVEVLQNVYDIEDVRLSSRGQDLKVELFLNLSSDGTAHIEVFNGSGTRLDNRTVTAKSDVFILLDTQQAKKVTGEVVVTLYDKNGNQRDSATRNWDGGN